MALGVVGSNPIIHPKRKDIRESGCLLTFIGGFDIGVWPNGKATDFDSVDVGSIPAIPTISSTSFEVELL